MHSTSSSQKMNIGTPQAHYNPGPCERREVLPARQEHCVPGEPARGDKLLSSFGHRWDDTGIPLQVKQKQLG